jgi:hypothetical protein
LAIDLTWRNVAALVALLSGVLVAFFAGTGGMMEWRIRAVQAQLDDRLELYQHEMGRLEQRLDRLEQRK